MPELRNGLGLGRRNESRRERLRGAPVRAFLGPVPRPPLGRAPFLENDRRGPFGVRREPPLFGWCVLDGV